MASHGASDSAAAIGFLHAHAEDAADWPPAHDRAVLLRAATVHPDRRDAAAGLVSGGAVWREDPMAAMAPEPAVISRKPRRVICLDMELLLLCQRCLRG